VLWSLLFFKMQRPDYALTEVAFLWLTVLALIVYLWPISKQASILLWPYLIWVSIASFLTYEIVKLNGPFT
jgi:tryptophan-rich sensory protein